MKNLFIALTFVLLTGSVISNPIEMPPVITEIFWDENGWTMELFFDESFCYYNLDELTLVCNEDTSAFVAGIPIVFNQPMVVTKYDLAEPFEIPLDGGFVDVLDTAYLNPITGGFAFGNHEWSTITPVSYGQSIVYQRFYVSGGYYDDLWLVKETQPSIGELPFECRTRAIFSGKVLDKLLCPVPNAIIRYTNTDPYAYSPSIPSLLTDENGEFSTDQMFCKEYTVRVYVDNEMELITILDIEPDSTNYCEFVLDSLYVGVKEDVHVEQKVSISARPNPFNGNLDINVRMTKGIPVKSPELKLFDLNGNVLKAADINSPYLNDVDIYWGAMDAILTKSGVYILALETEGKIIALQKVIFQK